MPRCTMLETLEVVKMLGSLFLITDHGIACELISRDWFALSVLSQDYTLLVVVDGSLCENIMP